MIDRRLTDESRINLHHGGNVIRDCFEAISSLLMQFQQISSLAGNAQGFTGPSGHQPVVQSLDPTAKVERSVPHGKYQKITLISTDLSTKFRISFNDKSLDNLNTPSRAWGASNLLSLVDGSRLIPQQSESNGDGYTLTSITASSDPLS